MGVKIEVPTYEVMVRFKADSVQLDLTASKKAANFLEAMNAIDRELEGDLYESVRQSEELSGWKALFFKPKDFVKLVQLVLFVAEISRRISIAYMPDSITGVEGKNYVNADSE